MLVVIVSTMMMIVLKEYYAYAYSYLYYICILTLPGIFKMLYGKNIRAMQPVQFEMDQSTEKIHLVLMYF